MREVTQFYIRQGDYLVSVVSGDAATVAANLEPGQEAVEGLPPGFMPQPTPFPGARWHIGTARWVDCRTPEELAIAAEQEVLAARRAAYPDLGDFADAVFWNALGDPSKLEKWRDQVAAVKAAHPKPGPPI